MSRVEVASVVKRYGTLEALSNVSIAFEDSEFFGLLGPSGSGKTTLLRAIAGFVDPDAGTISFDGERVEEVPVHRRRIGMVFQNYALFPNLDVHDNIAFGLDVRRVPKDEVRARVDEMLSLVRLTGLGERRPRQLSGGQQQRVALARALITRPKVLLLDEPLGALDRRLRQEMQVELKDIQRETGVTTIFVTHDQEEALTLSDRIAIIDRGKLVQVGAPQTVYERPGTLFAAQFLGDANVLSGPRSRTDIVLADGSRIEAPGRESTVVVRPEKIEVASGNEELPPSLRNRMRGVVLQAIYSGASVTYRIRTDALGETPLLAFVQNRRGEVLEPGLAVTAAWAPEHSIPVAS